MAKPVGLVLAGGRGRRIGRPKGELVIDGQGLASRAAEVLRPLCRRVLISLRRGASNPVAGFAAVEDGPPGGRGPLAGIQAGFEATNDADLLVLACDYPRVGTDLLERLLERADEAAELVQIGEESGRLHPLIGIWRRGIAGAVAEALASGRFKVRAVADPARTQTLLPDDFPGIDLGRALVHLNTREDLDSLDRN